MLLCVLTLDFHKEDIFFVLYIRGFIFKIESATRIDSNSNYKDPPVIQNVHWDNFVRFSSILVRPFNLYLIVFLIRTKIDEINFYLSSQN